MKHYFQILLDLPVFIHVKGDKVCEFLTWLLAIVAVGSCVGFMPSFIGRLYLPICGISLLYILSGGLTNINSQYIVLYLAFALSAVLSTEDLFNSPMRFIIFLVVTLVCAPCINSQRAIIFRALLSRNIFVLLILLTIGSFICYFLHINLVRDIYGDFMDENTVGGFGGLYSHSMILGPMSALVAIIFLRIYMSYPQKIYILLFFSAAGATVLSASRGAALSLVVATVYALLFMTDFGGTKRKIVKLLSIAILLSIPVAGRLTDSLMEKQERNVEMGGTFKSRESKWDNRINEFKDSPIIGEGFGAVSLSSYGDYNSLGGVEPGSSHLAVLSMTGLFGFVPYLIILISGLNSVRKSTDIKGNLKMLMLMAMLTVSCFEGFALAAGGFMCLMYWLIIGQCFDYKYIRNCK